MRVVEKFRLLGIPQCKKRKVAKYLGLLLRHFCPMQWAHIAKGLNALGSGCKVKNLKSDTFSGGGV